MTRLITITASEIKHPPRRRRWGPWSLTRSYELIHADTGYGVDLERCLNSAQVLDWICQVNGKRWATPEVIGQLVAALDEVLHPQATLCSFSVSKHLTAAEVRKRVHRHLDAAKREAR